MKVKELISELQKLDPERVVVLSKDSEGNNFSPIDAVETALYVPATLWYGDIYLETLSEQDIDLGYSEEDLYDGDDGLSAIVLWPTN